MFKKLVIAENTLDVDQWETFEVEDVLAFLKERFGDTLPAGARIYHEQVSEDNNVTPTDESGIEKLEKLEGTIYVMVFPEGPVLIILAVVVAVVAAAAFLLLPKLATPTLRNVQQQSPNNALSERTNTPRINARIPDIFGTVRSTPDLIAFPYTRFISGVETEFSDLCIGRGQYAVTDARDGESLLQGIAGTTLAVYAPNTSANNPSDTPQETIGSFEREDIYTTKKVNAINGQTLKAPNNANISGNTDIKFSTPNRIVASPSSGIDFTQSFQSSDPIAVLNARYTLNASDNISPFSAFFTSSGDVSIQSGSGSFSVGDTITIAGAVFTLTSGSIVVEVSLSGGIDIDFENETYSDTYEPVVDTETIALDTETVDLSGTYVISAVAGNVLTLASPETLNSDWTRISVLFPTGNQTPTKAISITNHSSSVQVDLDGTYMVLSVTSDEIVLSNPENVNSDWSKLVDLNGQETSYLSPRISSPGPRWVGWFNTRLDDCSRWLSNLVAQNGLFKDDGETQIASSVQIEIQIRPIDNTGTPTGATETFTVTLTGDPNERSAVGESLLCVPTFIGFAEIRARRITPTDSSFEGTVVDEVKWRDVYLQKNVEVSDFGNVTTLQLRTIATPSALAVKKRKLNLEVTRKVPRRISRTTFTAPEATNYCADILVEMSIDPFIGRRTIGELDLDDIYDTASAIDTHFGTSDASEFCYTFDKANVTYQETAAILANAVFCTAYRRGTLISLFFEKPTTVSALLLNHRNKLPGSETRTVSFGTPNDYDGIEYSYVDPSDDAVVTLYVPTDQSAINPQKTESIGVRNHLQAYFQMWRAWNKLLFQNLTTTFDATHEVDLLVIKERMLVADNTRTGTQDGEVKAQDGLLLTLSQDIEFDVSKSYSIFVQHTDLTVESIAITAGAKPNQVMLATAPLLPLAVDRDYFARATYQIVGSGEQNAVPFLLVEKSPRSKLTTGVTAVNYADEYYQNDKKFIDGDIDEDAKPLP